MRRGRLRTEFASAVTRSRPIRTRRAYTHTERYPPACPPTRADEIRKPLCESHYAKTKTSPSGGGELHAQYLALTLVELRGSAEVHHQTTVKTSPEEGQYGDGFFLAHPCSLPHGGRPQYRSLANLEAVPGLLCSLIGLSNRGRSHFAYA